MRQVIDLRQTHEACGSFDRVDATKHLVDEVDIDIGSRLFDAKELIFDVRQMFVGSTTIRLIVHLHNNFSRGTRNYCN